MKHQEVVTLLEKTVLVSAVATMFGVDREAGGGTMTNGVEKTRKAITVVDPKIMAPFQARKVELRRLLRSYGTRVTALFDAVAIPKKHFEEFRLKLDELDGRNQDDIENRLLPSWSKAVNDWALQHPEHAEQIHALAPSAADIARRIGIRTCVIDGLSPDAITLKGSSDSGEYDEDTLGFACASEVAAIVCDRFNDARSPQKWSARVLFELKATKSVLEEAARKLEAFSFAHPTFELSAAVITDVAESLNAEGGKLDTASAQSAKHVLTSLLDPYETLKGITAYSIPEACEQIEQPEQALEASDSSTATIKVASDEKAREVECFW